MAFMISPGVNTSEIDLTTIVPAVGTTVGALAGPFRWGPCSTRVLVSSELDILNQFQKPDINCFPTWFTGANFLGYGNALWITRVVGPAASNACVVPPIIAPGDTPFQVLNEDQYLDQFAGGQGFPEGTSVGMWAAKYPGDLGSSLAVSMADSANFATWPFRTSFNQPPNTSTYVANAGGSNDEIHVVVVDAGGAWTGTPGTVLETFPYLSKCAAAKNADGSTMYYADNINRLSNYVWWMDFPEFSKAGLETWGSTTLGTVFEVMSTGVVFTEITGGPFVVGETVQFATTATVSAPTSGTTATVSLTIDPLSGAVKAASVTNPGSGYSTAPTVTVTGPGSGASLVAYIASGQVTVVNVGANGTGYLTKSAQVTAQTGSSITITPVNGSFIVGDVVTGVASAAFGTVNDIEGGVLSAYAALSGGVDDNANIQAGDLILGYDLYKSAEDVDIALILSGNLGGVTSIDDMIAVSEEIINIAEYRKDCVAFFSPPMSAVVNNPNYESTDIVAYRIQLPDSSYAVMDSGWKYQYDKYNDAFRWIPLNGDIAGLCVRTDTTKDPWWSPAGFNRGQIMNVIRLAWNPRQAYRDLLYQNAVNPVITTTGEGTILYGDKTMVMKPSAFDRINVRRLFIVLEKSISTAAKYSLFEFNDAFTQASFINMVDPFLRGVQGGRGIYDYKVVCDSTNNTPQVIDSNQFVGDIYIKPARSINFIQLNFIAVSTGVSFDEVVGQF